MKPFYQETMATIYCGNALEVLKELPDNSVQMVMSSPPYWGLRNYAGGSDLVWGDSNCEHIWEGSEYHEHREEVKSGKTRTTERFYGEPSRKFDGDHQKHVSEVFCSKCGAFRGQLGLEPTPELYVEHLMLIFSELRRVLKREGSFYLNLGDTYSGGSGHSMDGKWPALNEQLKPMDSARPQRNLNISPKCMVCIPERVMFAMIQDGWVLRNKIIWHKSNAMPGSQKDRFTCTWEYLYFFVKNSKTILWRNRETGEWRDTKPAKEENYPYGMRDEEGNKCQPLWMGFDYYFDLDSVRVPHTTQSAPDWFGEMFPPDSDYKGKFDELFVHGPQPQSFNLRVRDVKRGKKGVSAQGGELKASEKEVEEYEYPEKANWREEAAKRGQLFDQPVAHQGGGNTGLTKHDQAVGRTGNVSYTEHPLGKNPGDYWEITTQPYKGAHFAVYPEKLCERPIKASSRVGDVVLDMFCGSGTTGVVAKRLGRKAILIDCVEKYCDIARSRISKVEYQPELPVDNNLLENYNG